MGSNARSEQAGEAYKGRAGAGRRQRVAEQLTQVPPRRNPTSREPGAQRLPRWEEGQQPEQEGVGSAQGLGHPDLCGARP